MIDPITFAAELAISRIESALDAANETYARRQLLLVVGRSLLRDDVPSSLTARDYPPGTGDDWRELADLAYEAAFECWFSGGADDDVRAAALGVVHERLDDRVACRGHEPALWQPAGVEVYCNGSCRGRRASTALELTGGAS